MSIVLLCSHYLTCKNKSLISILWDSNALILYQQNLESNITLASFFISPGLPIIKFLSHKNKVVVAVVA